MYRAENVNEWLSQSLQKEWNGMKMKVSWLWLLDRNHLPVCFWELSLGSYIPTVGRL